VAIFPLLSLGFWWWGQRGENVASLPSVVLMLSTPSPNWALTFAAIESLEAVEERESNELESWVPEKLSSESLFEISEACPPALLALLGLRNLGIGVSGLPSWVLGTLFLSDLECNGRKL